MTDNKKIIKSEFEERYDEGISLYQQELVDRCNRTRRLFIFDTCLLTVLTAAIGTIIKQHYPQIMEIMSLLANRIDIPLNH